MHILKMFFFKSYLISFCFIIIFKCWKPTILQHAKIDMFDTTDSTKKEKDKQFATVQWQNRYRCTKPDRKKIEAIERKIKKVWSKDLNN